MARHINWAHVYLAIAGIVVFLVLLFWGAIALTRKAESQLAEVKRDREASGLRDVDLEMHQLRRFPLSTLLLLVLGVSGWVLVSEQLYQGVTQHVVEAYLGFKYYSERTQPFWYWLTLGEYVVLLVGGTPYFVRLMIRIVTGRTTDPGVGPDDARR
jgi:hypothetical protein